MSVIRKLIGVLLILAAVLGLVFSIAAISFAWRVEQPLIENLQSTVDLLNQTMATTAEGLIITDSALKNSVDTISSLQSVVQTSATTIKTSEPMVDNISSLMENELPSTIRATEASLRSAAQSAQVIDRLLGTLSSIPLLGPSLNYDPDVPLSIALEEVADNLSDLPQAFGNMQESLEETTSNLATYEADLSMMAESIGEIKRNVAEYGNVIAGYKQSIVQISAGLENLKGNIPNIVHTIVLAATVFFVWMAIAQLGLMTQGWELLTEKPSKREEEPEQAPRIEEKSEPAPESEGETASAGE
jgi:chromosome segregation ATPase